MGMDRPYLDRSWEYPAQVQRVSNEWSWADGHDYVDKAGSVNNVAKWIEFELGQRNWTQEVLSRRMRAAGCPMGQPAISKLIKNDGRTVTVDQLIALSRVFGVPFGTLLLEPFPVDAPGAFRMKLGHLCLEGRVLDDELSGFLRRIEIAIEELRDDLEVASEADREEMVSEIKRMLAEERSESARKLLNALRAVVKEMPNG